MRRSGYKKEERRNIMLAGIKKYESLTAQAKAENR